MTRDELHGKIVGGLLLFRDGIVGVGALQWPIPEEVADSILALMPEMPKLEWRGDDLFLGDLHMGRVSLNGGMWETNFSGASLRSSKSEAVARAAVEAKVKEALGWKE